MSNSATKTFLRWACLCVVTALAVFHVTRAAAEDLVETRLAGRDALLHVPDRLPPSGTRALVIVMHGGLGNARRIATRQSESGLNMNAVADRYGFVVAYLNGTPVTRRLGDDKLGWNAGDCCGLSAEKRIDDVGYVTRSIDDLVREYGIDRTRVYAIGHSNGAMMAQRMMCETGVFAAAVPISGPLGLDVDRCPAARGKRLLAIHGAEDENVPVAGGRGTKGLSGTNFHSEAQSRQVFVDSGATYTIQIVAGADHRLDAIGDAILRTEHVSIAEKAARFFGLADPPR
jgi:polyhydroxybutyrate depolymerase